MAGMHGCNLTFDPWKSSAQAHFVLIKKTLSQSQMLLQATYKWLHLVGCLLSLPICYVPSYINYTRIYHDALSTERSAGYRQKAVSLLKNLQLNAVILSKMLASQSWPSAADNLCRLKSHGLALSLQKNWVQMYLYINNHPVYSGWKLDKLSLHMTITVYGLLILLLIRKYNAMQWSAFWRNDTSTRVLC